MLGMYACDLAAAPTPSYSPYYRITVPPNATATPTPFRPPTRTHLPNNTETLLTPTTAPNLGAATVAPNVAFESMSLVTFLLLGSDVRKGVSFRTDTIVVAIVRPQDGQVSLISIPRDLWVNIPDVGFQRINTAYQYGEINRYEGGGAGLLKDTIQNNLGIPIDHVAMVDFNGFKKIVDTLGGIDVPISCPYTDWRLVSPDRDPELEENWSLYTTGPGVIHMDGDLALWYARSRQKSNDFDRGRRQQEVLRALYNQARQNDIASHIPQLYQDFQSSIQTDLGLEDILAFTPMSLNMHNADIRSYYISGNLVTEWVTPEGAYVLLPNQEAIQTMLGQAIYPSAIQTERQVIKIEIRNTSGVEGLERLAAERLSYAGYETSIKLVNEHTATKTMLYDTTKSQNPDQQQVILAILGLSSDSIVSAPNALAQVQYVLTLGSDYEPCFNPADLVH